MGKREGDPNGAADTVPPASLIDGCPGKNSTKCDLTPIGPIPGPPPP